MSLSDLPKPHSQLELLDSSLILRNLAKGFIFCGIVSKIIFVRPKWVWTGEEHHCVSVRHRKTSPYPHTNSEADNT